MSQENKLLSQSHQESLGPNSSMQDRNDSFLERWLHELGLIPPETALTWWGGGDAWDAALLTAPPLGGGLCLIWGQGGGALVIAQVRKLRPGPGKCFTKKMSKGATRPSF